LFNDINACSWDREPVAARSSLQTIQAKGIYPTAKVVRGLDWADEYKNQDGKNMLYDYQQRNIGLQCRRID